MLSCWFFYQRSVHVLKAWSTNDKLQWLLQKTVDFMNQRLLKFPLTIAPCLFFFFSFIAWSRLQFKMYLLLQVTGSNMQQTSTSVQRSKKGPFKCRDHLFEGSRELSRQQELEGLIVKCVDSSEQGVDSSSSSHTPLSSQDTCPFGPGRRWKSGYTETRGFLKETWLRAGGLTTEPDFLAVHFMNWGVYDVWKLKYRCWKTLPITLGISAVSREENQSWRPAEGMGQVKTIDFHLGQGWTFSWPPTTPKIKLRWIKTYMQKAKP